MTIILLAIGGFLAAVISGAAGFGGALLLLPLLTYSVGVTEAVPLLTAAQLIGNLARAGFGYRDIRWQPVALFLLTGIPCAALGAVWFADLPANLVVRLAGLVIVIFALGQALGWFRFVGGPRVILFGGAIVGLISGLVGSAGPLGAAVFLSLNLPPVAYVASEAVTAIAMHGVKTVVYGSRLDFSPAFWPLVLVLGSAMVAGSWVGKRLITAMPVQWFRQFVAALLVATCAYMIVSG